MTALNGDVYFTLEGRSFTRTDLKRCIIHCNEGHITPMLFDNVPLWELIEAIEISTEFYEARVDV